MKTQPIPKTLLFCVALSIASLAESDVVTDWNTAALNAIRADKTPPPDASRALAILHASVYDAVNGIVRSHKPYFVKEKAPMTASQEAAASAAAHRVLMTLFRPMRRPLRSSTRPRWMEFGTARTSDEAGSGANQ